MSASKRAVNLSVDADLLREAGGRDMNLWATLERALAEALRQDRRERWLAENKQGIATYNDPLEELGTRVVIPLTPASVATKRSTMQTLTPICTVEGKTYLLVTPQLAGIAAKELGPPIANHSHDRQAIIAALDLLYTGISIPQSS